MSKETVHLSQRIISLFHSLLRHTNFKQYPTTKWRRLLTQLSKKWRAQGQQSGHHKMELVLLTTDSYSALQWPEKGTTAEELFTRAKANGYQRGAHREKDSIRDDNNHTEKTKRDQDRFLYVYVK
jgi:hypothetical protein